MSQQINLYDSALLRKRELLTAANVAGTALVLMLAMGGWGASLRAQIAQLEGESLSVASVAKGVVDQLNATARQLSEVKPDQQLVAALTSAQTLLGLRSEVVAVLKKGIGADSTSFAEYLRGFARQTPNGLWLTGFTIGEGGATMEIRGRMTDPALLPLYIQRLNGEKAFKGRGFAALSVSAGKTEAPRQAADVPAPGAKPAGAARTPFLEFVLTPSAAVAPPAPASTSREPQKLADLLPADAAKALEGNR